MSGEREDSEKKSLRLFTRRNPDWGELAKDCVCFANAMGGRIRIGIEDGEKEPPSDQLIPPDLTDKVRKRVGELTVNVPLAVSVATAGNGGELLELLVSRSHAPASTTDGRYYVRISDQCKPLLGDDIQRLLNERSAQPWETLTGLGVPRDRVDLAKLASFGRGIRASDRVKPSVKEKTDQELLDHYLLAEGGLLTQLGVLCVGQRQDRARLGTAPVVQFLKFDESGRKVNKIVWDDFSLSPMELVEAVWSGVPDFREFYELPDGLFRQPLPRYDEVVVRELLVNALVHRPYTQRGDIFLNLHPERLEVVNPGLLPLGVTPRNVLHTTVRRNEHLARVFHDLRLMEREGSGFDRMYEVLLSQGRPVPELREGPDRVEVVVGGRVLNPQVIAFMAKAEDTFQLTQRERITLGLLAQHEALTAQELADRLELANVDALSSWFGRLQRLKLVRSIGRTRGTRYFVDPALLRRLDFSASTTLRRIEPHRLAALIVEDLRHYPGSAIGEVHARIAPEIPRTRVKRTLDELIKQGAVISAGEKRWRRYSLST
jgi:ATP-dependent DNA helicase RecG